MVNGAKLTKEFADQYFPALHIDQVKGRVIDARSGMQYVWIHSTEQFRAENIHDAFDKHNETVGDSLKIRFAGTAADGSEDIICSEDRKRLQKHPYYKQIMKKDATYWEVNPASLASEAAGDLQAQHAQLQKMYGGGASDSNIMPGFEGFKGDKLAGASAEDGAAAGPSNGAGAVRYESSEGEEASAHEDDDDYTPSQGSISSDDDSSVDDDHPCTRLRFDAASKNQLAAVTAKLDATVVMLEAAKEELAVEKARSVELQGTANALMIEKGKSAALQGQLKAQVSELKELAIEKGKSAGLQDQIKQQGRELVIELATVQFLTARHKDMESRVAASEARVAASESRAAASESRLVASEARLVASEARPPQAAHEYLVIAPPGFAESSKAQAAMIAAQAATIKASGKKLAAVSGERYVAIGQLAATTEKLASVTEELASRKRNHAEAFALLAAMQ